MTIPSILGRLFGLLVLIAAVTSGPPAAKVEAAQSLALPPLDSVVWSAWKTSFVKIDGRVIDNGNGNISHSEGQGYGLLLAVSAGDREAFDLIWNWTQQTLEIRDDSLFAWRFDPAAKPQIADHNNASDGDMLIAWALARAADAWNEPDYRKMAALIARDLQATSVIDSDHGRLLLPGAAGFDRPARKDGPVVNLSYWVFPAFADLAPIAPEHDWNGLADNGLALARTARFGRQQLPSDWIALGGKAPAPASGFPPEFGWNAIRIPLYVAWSGLGNRDLLAPYAALWAKSPDPTLIDVATGKTGTRFGASGYRAVPALVACAMDGTRLPDEVRSAPMDQYYPSTLRLLVLAAAAERYPSCL